MSTFTDEDMRKILKPLEEYYANNPKKFILGLQNFQSIREYTEIPLAPITLIYGQNSAGKSAIHDGLIFVSEFLQNGKVPGALLERWANRSRNERPLNKGFIGQAEDVVVSIEAWGCWQPMGDINKAGTSILSDLWNDEMKEPHRFQFRFHFSYIESDYVIGWELSELSLAFGQNVFLAFKSNQYDGFKAEGILSVNTQHVLFDVLGKLAGQSLAEMATETTFLNGDIEADKQWLNFKDIGLKYYGSKLEFEWPESVGDYDQDLNDYFHMAATLRGLLTGMLVIPSMIAAHHLKIISVPPLRPVPKKAEAYFHIASSDNSIFINEEDTWIILASEIRDNEILHLGNLLLQNKSAIESGSICLDYINHVLQHPLFLNTGYEIVGECRFLLSVEQIKAMMDDDNDNISYWGQYIDAEVKLKLRYIPDDFIVEIEDVGVGISQIIPVLCAISNSGGAYIHQPELHLHPKQQSHLGDIFIERINEELNNEYRVNTDSDFNRFFFIETHSEHILLRILRRIRESHRSQIKNKLFGFTSDQLCVLYVDKDKNGDSQIMQLRVADNGEFIDRWPHGFFTERDEDLFDE